MKSLRCFASYSGRFCVVMMSFQEAYLLLIPLLFISYKTVRFPFEVQCFAGCEKIFTAQVIKIRIADNLFEVILRRLREFGGGNHTKYPLQLIAVQPKSRQKFLCNHTTAFFMIFINIQEAGVMKQRGNMDYQQILGIGNIFFGSNPHGFPYHINCMMNTMIGKARIKASPQLLNDECFYFLNVNQSDTIIAKVFKISTFLYVPGDFLPAGASLLMKLSTRVYQWKSPVSPGLTTAK